MVKQYKITYKQEFWGEFIEDTYIRTVQNKSELRAALAALYEDPCVFSVECEEIKENKIDWE